MNANEPVAWAVWEGKPHDVFLYKEEADELCRLKGGDAKSVPLYTHPADLTDEEIEQVRVAIMGVAYWCADENMPEAYNAVKVCCAQVLGILVKTQEK